MNINHISELKTKYAIPYNITKIKNILSKSLDTLENNNTTELSEMIIESTKNKDSSPIKEIKELSIIKYRRNLKKEIEKILKESTAYKKKQQKTNNELNEIIKILKKKYIINVKIKISQKKEYTIDTEKLKHTNNIDIFQSEKEFIKNFAKKTKSEEIQIEKGSLFYLINENKEEIVFDSLIDIKNYLYKEIEN